MTDTTPRSTLVELDRYIVGQTAAKKALAVALRDRDRRLKVEEPMRSEIGPKNILLIGPTGVGKTEIVKRLARMVDAPFLKVEATKFTEVGYVGHDVESIIRDLADASVNLVHQERMNEVQDAADRAAMERLVGYLMKSQAESPAPEGEEQPSKKQTTRRRRKASMARMLKNHELEDNVVEIEVENEDGFSNVLEFVSGMGSDEVTEQFHEFMNSLRPRASSSAGSSPRSAKDSGPGRGQQAHRFRSRSSMMPFAASRKAALSSLTKSTSWSPEAVTMARTSQARESSETFCRSSREHRLPHATAWSKRTTFCSSARAPSIAPDQPTCCPSCKADFL